MKKLLKFFAVPAVLACGLLVSCNNGGMDLDLNPVVSTDTPSLAEPKNLGYGVLLTWNCTQDGSSFKVTRQEKGGEEKTLDFVSENRYIDCIGLLNPLKEGVEYTYRVYNLGDKGNVGGDTNIDNTGDYNNYSSREAGANYGINYIVKDSYAERKITLAAGSLKAKGAKLDADKAENVDCSFKNGSLTIRFLNNDENHRGCRNIKITNVDTNRVIYTDEFWDNLYWRCNDWFDADKITVEITNAWGDDYYADSDALKIENIENVVNPDSVDVQHLEASLRDGKVVLLWTTNNEDAVAGDFTIQRKDSNSNSAKYETLKIAPTSGTKYDGTKYWTATDSTIEVGKYYAYQVITDDVSKSTYISVHGSIKILNASWDGETEITLQWTAENISDFIIYRAEGDLSSNEEKYYDLFTPLSITFEKLYDTIEDGKKISVYTAKDTVEKNKDYTYRVVSKADGYKVYSEYNYSRSTKPSTFIYLEFLDENGSRLSESYDSWNEELYYDFSGNADDKITLKFYGNSDVTYKGFWTTNDYEAHSFTIEKDQYNTCKHEFKASDFGMNYGQRVYFYVQVYIGEELEKEESTSIYISIN